MVKKVSASSFFLLIDFFSPSEEQMCQTILFPFVLLPVQVEFVIGYTRRGELTYANVNVILADVDPDQLLLLQIHSVRFQVSFCIYSFQQEMEAGF